MKLLPIGISNFKEIIEQNYYYIDKTRLIDEILKKGKVILLPRPRRFGKTLNLSMLRYFFELNEDNKHLFSHLEISENNEAIKHQGKYPVIFLTFKNIRKKSWQEAYEEFAMTISAEFYRHDYLLQDPQLDEIRKARFKRILAEEASATELANSLLFLSQLLFNYHKNKVVLLIDEYDTPIQTAFIEGYYTDAIEFLRSLLSSILKDAEVMEKGVLTGILTLAKEGIFSGLNNLNIFNLTHEPFSDVFGFTHEETTAFLQAYGITDVNAVKEWYDGYTIGNTSGIYNPWSVIKCIQAQGKIELYWANTSDNALIKTLIAQAPVTMKIELESLLSQSSVSLPIEEAITFPDLHYRVELIWSLLLFTGYLTYSSCSLVAGKKQCTLLIPNQEIKYLYIHLIQEIFQKAVTGGQTKQLLEALIQANVTELTTLLQSFIINTMSTYDISQNEPEKSYHLFVLGLLVLLNDEYYIRSNRESGIGRYDITLFPKRTNLPGIIIEFKVTRPPHSLEETTDLALAQIIQKKYAQELQEQKAFAIIAYGIAFAGKEIFIKSCLL